MPEGSVPGDEAGVGRARAPHPDELPGYATSQHGGDPQYDDAGPADMTSGPGHVWDTPGAGGERNHGERVRGPLQGGLRTAYRHAREGLQREALHQKHDYDGNVQRREYQAGELVMDSRHNVGTNTWNEVAVPWFGPALITKVLDRGRVVVRRK